MPDYQPYLIADYQAGEWAGKEPWLAPEAAWRTLRNGYVKNGQLRKRMGYELLANVGAARTVVALIENRMLDGTSELVALTDRRFYRLESGAFVNRTSGGDFTGGDSDYFSGATASDDALYITNGVDRPRKWVGATATMTVANQTGLTATLNSARWVVWWKGRLWYFYTNEGGGAARFPQRGRFSQVNQPETFRDTDFVDATTSERMTGVHILGERLILDFEDSKWTMVETGDFRLPFVPRRIPATYGALGRFASFEANDVLVSMSRFGLVATNGDSVEKIDPELPRLIDRFASDKSAYLYGGRDPRNQHGWILFVEVGDTGGRPNDALIYDWENGSFAFYEIPLHVIGSFRATSAVLWSSLTLPWDSYSIAWDDFASGSEAPILLGGDRLGNVWKLETGSLDGKTASVAGTAISLRAKTQSLNPFKGLRTRMGYLDLYAAPSIDTTVRVKVYRDAESSPVLVKDISLIGAGAEEKVMRRIVVNKTAGFFSIEIEHTGNETIQIDALRLWMAPIAKGRSF